jgi:phosphotransacetylase
MVMKPLFAAAKKIAKENKRIVFCEGEDERILRAVQRRWSMNRSLILILIGRPHIIENRVKKLRLTSCGRCGLCRDKSRKLNERFKRLLADLL